MTVDSARPSIENIKTRLTEIICESLGVDPGEVTMDADLVHDLGCDSLDVVEIVMDIEQEFNFAIDDEKASDFTLVRDIVNFLQAEIGGGQ
jgi:acyl carrier protein